MSIKREGKEEAKGLTDERKRELIKQISEAKFESQVCLWVFSPSEQEASWFCSGTDAGRAIMAHGALEIVLEDGQDNLTDLAKRILQGALFLLDLMSDTVQLSREDESEIERGPVVGEKLN